MTHVKTQFKSPKKTFPILLLLFFTFSFSWAIEPDSTFKKAKYYDNLGEYDKGGFWFEKAGKEYLSHNQPIKALEAYRLAANSFSFLIEKEKALELLSKCDKIVAKELKSNLTEKIKNEFYYGIVYNYTDENERSNKILLPLENKLKDPKDKIKRNEMIAWNYFILENNLLAKKYAEKNYVLLKAKPSFLNDDPNTQVMILNTYAASLYGINLFYEASKIYEELVAKTEKIYSKKHVRYISTIGNLASCYSALGLIKEPLELRMSIANEIAVREKSGFYEAIANLYDNQRKFKEAITYYLLADKYSGKLPENSARLYSNMLLSFAKQKDSKNGSIYVKKLNKLLNNRRLEPNVKAYIYKMLAYYFYETDQLTIAEKNANLALNYYKIENDKPEEINEVLQNFGNIRFKQKRLNEALNYYYQFENQSETSLQSLLRIDNQLVIAKVLSEQKEYKKAEKVLQEIIDANKTNYYFTSITEAYLALAKIQTQINVVNAQKTTIEGIHFLNQLSKQSWESDDLSATFYANIELFDLAKSLTYDLYLKRNTEQLMTDFLFISEVEKFVNIRKEIIGKNQLLKSSIDKSYLYKLNNINASIAYFQSFLNTKSIDSTQNQLYKNQIPILLLEKKKLLQQLQIKFPTYYKLIYQNEIATLSYLRQNLLHAQNTFINFSVDGQHNIYLLTMTQKQTVLQKVSFDATKTIMLMNLALQKNEISAYSQHAQVLYQKLISPIRSLCQKEIIISPDKELNLFNFELLIPPSNKNHFVVHDCLLFQHTFRYILSATIEKEGEVLRSNNENVAFAPINFENQNYSSLPFSKILTDFLQKNFAFSTLKYQNANKESFLENIQKSNIFNLASHITIDEENINNSKILLYGKNENNLSIFDINGITLSNRLVVLLGCNSGKGFFENPMTIQSVALTFLNAGSKAVIMSNHEIDEKASTQIIEKFYYYLLKKNLSKSEALQKAKIDFITQSSDEKLKNPYYWAGLILLGSDENLTKTHYAYLFLLFIPLILILFYWFLVKRKNTKHKTKNVK